MAVSASRAISAVDELLIDMCQWQQYIMLSVTLGTGSIMFSGCPSVRAVRPEDLWTVYFVNCKNLETKMNLLDFEVKGQRSRSWTDQIWSKSGSVRSIAAPQVLSNCIIKMITSRYSYVVCWYSPCNNYCRPHTWHTILNPDASESE